VVVQRVEEAADRKLAQPMPVAIIPARGGSKRIPRKNLREFCGKPIIAYSIETATSSGLFDSVWVSTDDAEIAEVAKSFGAKVPFMRPAELANDYASTLDVMAHAVAMVHEGGLSPNSFCFLYATAPFVQAENLAAGLQALETDDSLDYAFSCTTFPFPVQRAFRIDANQCASAVWPDSIPRRSQDLEPLYHDAGQFYWGRPNAFTQRNPIFAGRSIPIVLPRYLVQDIDEEDDWVRAEWMYKAWKASSSKP
jgi:pseudaminic acid cytidylyltransferase